MAISKQNKVLDNACGCRDYYVEFHLSLSFSKFLFKEVLQFKTVLQNAFQCEWHYIQSITFGGEKKIEINRKGYNNNKNIHPGESLDKNE